MLKAELWAIKQALKLCKEKGWPGAPVETDCLAAVELINENEDIPNHPECIIIEECRALKAEIGCTVTHIPREVNQWLTRWQKWEGTKRSNW